MEKHVPPRLHRIAWGGEKTHLRPLSNSPPFCLNSASQRLHITHSYDILLAVSQIHFVSGIDPASLCGEDTMKDYGRTLEGSAKASSKCDGQAVDHHSFRLIWAGGKTTSQACITYTIPDIVAQPDPDRVSTSCQQKQLLCISLLRTEFLILSFATRQNPTLLIVKAKPKLFAYDFSPVEFAQSDRRFIAE